MQRTMLRAKIHRATVSGLELDYEGSIAIDVNLLEAADISARCELLVQLMQFFGRRDSDEDGATLQ